MTHKLAALGAAVATAAVLTPTVFAQSGTPGGQTITFKELNKGSTFHFIDNPPRAKRIHGFPSRISVGDRFIFTNPTANAEGPLGSLRATCDATHASRNFEKADFVCMGAFVSKAGTMFADTADTAGKVTTGAIVGGTGAYAGARGTFTSTEVKGGSDDVITLLP
jgi:hypothetical protein